MQFQLDCEVATRCHPSDLWEIFSRIEEWKDWSGVFGQAGWIHGKPWEQGSRFFREMLFPCRIDFEVVVLKCDAPNHVVLLSHGGGLAAEQWLAFVPDGEDITLIRNEETVVGTPQVTMPELRTLLKQFYENWFDNLKAQAEKPCSPVAL